jgi:hypothetical protein
MNLVESSPLRGSFQQTTVRSALALSPAACSPSRWQRAVPPPLRPVPGGRPWIPHFALGARAKRGKGRVLWPRWARHDHQPRPPRPRRRARAASIARGGKKGGPARATHARAARRVARRAGSTGPGTWTMVECPMIELYCQ